MTVRDLYDAALIEINKLEAPSMLLEDYNYFINKAIQQYINKAYNRYEINQQATDDLGVLKTYSTINVITDESPRFPGESKTYYCKLPNDYWHALNCVVTFKNNDDKKCASKNEFVSTVARKLTSDIYPTVISNAYFKPSPKCPYYSIQQLVDNGSGIIDYIINPCVIPGGRDILDEIIDPCNLNGTPYSGHAIHIFCGDTRKMVPSTILINYLRIPKKIQLTEDDLAYGEDGTEEMEFPDYVCYEIINEFVKLLLENTADPRLSTNVPINQSIIGEISAE